jgi:hypothetical protein
VPKGFSKDTVWQDIEHDIYATRNQGEEAKLADAILMKKIKEKRSKQKTEDLDLFNEVEVRIRPQSHAWAGWGRISVEFVLMLCCCFVVQNLLPC